MWRRSTKAKEDRRSLAIADFFSVDRPPSVRKHHGYVLNTKRRKFLFVLVLVLLVALQSFFIQPARKVSYRMYNRSQQN